MTFSTDQLHMVALQFTPETMSFEHVALDALECPFLRTGLNHWRLLRGGRRFPAREDLKPREIAGLLRRMSLIRVKNGDFQYRIVGDCVVQAYDIQLHNRWLNDIESEFPRFVSFVRPVLMRVVETREPVAVRGSTGHGAPRVNFTHYENLLLPLGPDDDTVDHILNFTNYVMRPLPGGCR